MKTPEEWAEQICHELAPGVSPLRDLRTVLADAIRVAVADAVVQPMPSPISQQRLDEIRNPGNWLKPLYDKAVKDLFQHIDHLEAIIRDVAQDPACAAGVDGMQRMYRLGWMNAVAAIKHALDREVRDRWSSIDRRRIDEIIDSLPPSVF